MAWAAKFTFGTSLVAAASAALAALLLSMKSRRGSVWVGIFTVCAAIACVVFLACAEGGNYGAASVGFFLFWIGIGSASLGCATPLLARRVRPSDEEPHPDELPAPPAALICSGCGATGVAYNLDGRLFCKQCGRDPSIVNVAAASTAVPDRPRKPAALIVEDERQPLASRPPTDTPNARSRVHSRWIFVIPMVLLLAGGGGFLVWRYAGKHAAEPSSTTAVGNLRTTIPAKCDSDDAMSVTCTFELAGTKFRIDNNGAGQRVTPDGASRAFKLPFGDTGDGTEAGLGSVYFVPYGRDIIIVYGVGTVEAAWGQIARLNPSSPSPVWNATISGFNVGEGVVEDRFLYQTAFGFVGKLDLESGKYAWKHEGLYDASRASFNSFEVPEVLADEIIFTETFDAESAVRRTSASNNVGRTIIGPRRIRVHKADGSMAVEEDPREAIRTPASIAKVTASSTHADGAGYTFNVTNLIDGDLRTSWQPVGSTEPQWIRLDFARDTIVTAVVIANGFQTMDKYGDEFALNSRIARAFVRFPDGQFPIEFTPNARGWTYFEMPGRTTRSITLLIDRTHRGSRWNDLAVSEIEVEEMRLAEPGTVSAASLKACSLDEVPGWCWLYGRSPPTRDGWECWEDGGRRRRRCTPHELEQMNQK